jgi:hypothetical protein
MKIKPYHKPAHNQPCQRIKHDHAACSNVTGDPAVCAPGCQPAPCRADGDHPGGDHLNPRSEHYDGPILPGYREGEAWRTILAVLPDTSETRVAVHLLVEALRTAEDQATHARVDRDRGIREAITRSESCEHHGQEIKALGVQLHAADKRHDKAEAARLALLGFLNAVDDVVRGHPGEQGPGQLLSLLSALAGAVKKTHAAHDRAWRS